MLRAEHRVVVLKVPSPAVNAVADAVMLGAKNIENTLLYLARNILSSYEWDKEAQVLRRRAVLHQSQTAVLAALNSVIADFNAYWLVKAAGQAQTDGSPKPAKRLELLGPEITSATLNKAVTHANVMERLFKAYQHGTGFEDYRVLPAVIAQGALARAVQSVKNYIAAVIAYHRALRANPAHKAGRPQLPAYLGKNERRGFGVNEAQLSAAGRLPALSPERHVLASSFKGAPLAADAVEAWNRFDFAALKGQTLANLKLRVPEQMALRMIQVRCVPEAATGRGRRKYGVKWELVVELAHELSKQSLLAQAIAGYGLSGKKTFERLSPSECNAVCLDFAAQLGPGVVAAGIDPGVVNHATLATTTGHHVVYAGKKVNARWTRLNQSLDQYQSAVYRRMLPPGLHDKVQRNKAQMDAALREAITEEERTAIAEANRVVYADPRYLVMRQALQEQKKNHLHQLSSDILAHCLGQGVQVLVLGRNKGWKDEVQMGRRQNRLFTTIAHAQLYQLLRYKAQAHGILVVETEESYTSKSSFVHNDELPVKGDTDSNKHQFSGTRSGQDYKSKKKAGVPQSTVHADLNGALNILRKLLKGFKYRAGFSLRYVIKTIAHRWRPLNIFRAPGAARGVKSGLNVQVV